jgi:predicted  nucleic acid-binding Zn-ribbon protein
MVVERTDAQLESDLQGQKKELGKLQERLRGELRTLDAAKSEHSRVLVAIEGGATGKETDLSRAKESVELAEIRVQGLRKQVAPIEAKIGELTEEINRRQVEAARAARERAFAQLQEEGGALAAVIVKKLMELTTEELAALDRIRIRLGLEFPDLGGPAAADSLAALLFRPSQGMEKLRDPNTHNRLLEDRGWAFAGKPGPSYMKIPSATSQFGNPLTLTVQSMRPRE